MPSEKPERSPGRCTGKIAGTQKKHSDLYSAFVPASGSGRCQRECWPAQQGFDLLCCASCEDRWALLLGFVAGRQRRQREKS